MYKTIFKPHDIIQQDFVANHLERFIEKQSFYRYVQKCKGKHQHVHTTFNGNDEWSVAHYSPARLAND